MRKEYVAHIHLCVVSTLIPPFQVREDREADGLVWLFRKVPHLSQSLGLKVAQ